MIDHCPRRGQRAHLVIRWHGGDHSALKSGRTHGQHRWSARARLSIWCVTGATDADKRSLRCSIARQDDRARQRRTQSRVEPAASQCDCDLSEGERRERGEVTLDRPLQPCPSARRRAPSDQGWQLARVSSVRRAVDHQGGRPGTAMGRLDRPRRGVRRPAIRCKKCWNSNAWTVSIMKRLVPPMRSRALGVEEAPEASSRTWPSSTRIREDELVDVLEHRNLAQRCDS